MPVTVPERYVVASCHVERPLDERVWSAFSALQRRRPGGIEIAALLRPPDTAAGEHDVERWLARARDAMLRGTFGHHTHWTSPTHARPTGPDPGQRVRDEGAWLRAHGLEPTHFCGGGWYTDSGVAEAVAALGYVDCTPRATRPPYLGADEAWAELAAPARVLLPSGAELAVSPTTHSAGDGLRVALGRTLPARVHVYFHDTDLVDRRRRAVVVLALRLLGARLHAARLADDDPAAAPRVRWADVARGRAARPG